MLQRKNRELRQDLRGEEIAMKHTFFWNKKRRVKERCIRKRRKKKNIRTKKGVYKNMQCDLLTCVLKNDIFINKKQVAIAGLHRRRGKCPCNRNEGSKMHMFSFVLGILIVVVSIVAFGFKKERVQSGDRTKIVSKWGFRPLQLLAIVGVIFMGVGCVTSVPTGHTGVVTTFGNVENYTYEAGIHVKSPFQQVTNMDNRTQKQVVDMTAFSSDIQEVKVTFSLNYQISKENAQTIYRTIGVSYYDTVVAPRIQEAVKTIFAQYSADNLISQRSSLSEQIETILKENLVEYNIIVLSAAVEDIDFSDAFTDAVEAKQVAEQNKLKAQIEQQQAILEAEAAAERSIIAAEAAAEVTRIEAEVAKYAGEKEAEMNKKLAENMTPELIQYYYAQAWDGKLPEYVAGADSTTLPILNMGGSTSSSSTSGSAGTAGSTSATE